MSRSTSRVLRLRALTPTTVAPASTARARLVLVVDLDEGGHAELAGERLHPHEVGLAQGGDDEQDEVGAVRAGLVELVVVDHEVLAQHRDPHGGPDRVEVVQGAAEAAPLGEDADRGGAARGVLLRQRGGVLDGGQRALAGAGPLHLGDERQARLRAARPRRRGPGAASRASRSTSSRGTRACAAARSSRTPATISSRTVGMVSG